jgi:hypothetical protein
MSLMDHSSAIYDSEDLRRRVIGVDLIYVTSTAIYDSWPKNLSLESKDETDDGVWYKVIQHNMNCISANCMYSP